MLAGVCQWGCNVLKHSSNPLGSIFVSCAFELDCIEGSYPTSFYFSVPPILTGQCCCFYQFLHTEVILVFRLYGIWVFSFSSSFPIKYCDFCFQERKLLIFYLHTLHYVVPSLLIAPGKLGDFSLQLTKGSPFSDSTGQGFQTLIDCLSKK